MNIVSICTQLSNVMAYLVLHCKKLLCISNCFLQFCWHLLGYHQYLHENCNDSGQWWIKKEIKKDN